MFSRLLLKVLNHCGRLSSMTPCNGNDCKIKEKCERYYQHVISSKPFTSTLCDSDQEKIQMDYVPVTEITLTEIVV